MPGETVSVGDIVSALFPVHDPRGHEQEGRRPAVVVGIPAVLGTPRFPVLLLAPFTADHGQSWAKRSPALYPRFPKGAAKLRSDSICLLDQVRTLDIERVLGYRGTLRPDQYRPIADGLRRIFADTRED